jgi:hypothetical protein
MLGTSGAVHANEPQPTFAADRICPHALLTFLGTPPPLDDSASRAVVLADYPCGAPRHREPCGVPAFCYAAVAVMRPSRSAAQ